MAIEPYIETVFSVFDKYDTFEVPRYQRGYAWDDDAIDDFILDIKSCLDLRRIGEQKTHFFGGIVVTPKEVSNSSRTSYEVIDGQQRLASCVMLVSTLVNQISDVISELNERAVLASHEVEIKHELEESLEKLSHTYLVYKNYFNLIYSDIPKLTLSEADNNYFSKLLSGDIEDPSRPSHHRILTAYYKLRDFFAKTVGDLCIEEKAETIRTLINDVLAEDCQIIFMRSNSRSEVYQVFQVLNNRGVNLNDGDLLRASTMQKLNSSALELIQNEVAKYWDRILIYPNKDIERFLFWYFASYEGRRPVKSKIASEFLQHRFACFDKSTLNEHEANNILEEVKQMDSDFKLMKTIDDGNWPYSGPSTVRMWDRERLTLLTTYLGHTNAMPLLLALCRSEERVFASAVSIIERTVFRYKTIGNAHISSLTSLYNEQAKKVRNNEFSIEELLSKMKSLVLRKVPDTIFRSKLRELRYSTQTGNRHIRYLLCTLEDYFVWYEAGACGSPQGEDKVRVLDFANTSIEHVYSSNPETSNIDTDLEEVKDTIGNLTILGPADNASLGNMNYADKQPHFRNSNLIMNRKVAENAHWTKEIVAKRTKDHVDMAMKVFVS